MGRQERQASSYDLARGMADGPGGSGTAVAGYFLDGRAVAEGEVHGMDGVMTGAGNQRAYWNLPWPFVTMGENFRSERARAEQIMGNTGRQKHKTTVMRTCLGK